MPDHDEVQHQIAIANEISDRLATLGKPPMTPRMITRAVLQSAEGRNSVMRNLNGNSPTGNAMMDRGKCAREFREIATKMKLDYPADCLDVKIARLQMQELKAAQIPMQRNGKIDTLLLAAPKAE